ncbi:MAG TPA: 3-methyl-2-oxobutanoate hydroxymethyltransferase [Polyangiaceae bacterium]|nr:3-methyl-2-oxobutanoate hydroxymethyltransferase [Polyangiaceae bacterium]
MRKVTVPSLLARKGGEKIAVLTAYDATLAQLLDQGGADVLLVGDSLGMVVQGRPNTLAVTLEEMAYHCRAVARGASRAHVVCDLPFMSYQASSEEALRSAGKLVKEGNAEAVKLEGAGGEACDAVRRIVAAGIPVMGHIGLTPQAVHRMGGFKVQGKTKPEQERLLTEARALVQAGVYALVIEGVPSDVGRAITEASAVPTIGIGAGPHCDGQVLVCYDLLGLVADLKPKFVRRYAQLGTEITQAVAHYVSDVRQGSFPSAQESFAGATGLPENPEGSA